jgi:hypothetical protein
MALCVDAVWINKNKKANRPFAFFLVVGADGIEPPTYAL